MRSKFTILIVCLFCSNYIATASNTSYQKIKESILNFLVEEHELKKEDVVKLSGENFSKEIYVIDLGSRDTLSFQCIKNNKRGVYEFGVIGLSDTPTHILFRDNDKYYFYRTNSIDTDILKIIKILEGYRSSCIVKTIKTYIVIYQMNSVLPPWRRL